MQQKKLHASLAPFSFTDDCFICGKKLVDSESHKPIEIRHVQTKDIRETILKLCAEQNDEQKRYHLKFYTSLKRESHVRERPVDSKSKSAFDELCAYIEASNEY